MKTKIIPLWLVLGVCLTAFGLLAYRWAGFKPDSRTNADTTVAVYGPYRLTKLPITKGVRILNPVQLALGPRGQLFAANKSGEVYRLRDSDGDGLEDEAVLYCNVTALGLQSPAGFAHKGDTVFIGTSQEIRAFLDTNNDGKADKNWTVFKDIPYSRHPYEWTAGLTVSPDGWLYCALTTDSWNAGASPDPNQYRGAILRISPDGKQVSKVATGIRSVYGMAFNEHGDLFFTDNAGGGNPTEELNLLVKEGFYGHNKAKYKTAETVQGPAYSLETEVAPSGIIFNRPDNPFGGTAGDLFVAFYGPGERWTRGAVSRVSIIRAADGRYSFREQIVADVPKLSALAFGRNGALYLANHGVADYWYNSTQPKSGSFYKLEYDPALAGQPAKVRNGNRPLASVSSREAGRQLFAEYACLACHQVDGTTELLGPNLKGIGKQLSREDILGEILHPSRVIKPGMAGSRITKKDGQVLLGRVVYADAKQISLMLVGNQVVKISRSEIAQTTDETKSLMYENLLKNRPQHEIDQLLDYVVSL